MSAMGQKQTSRPEISMSALPPKADIVQHGGNVRFVPQADSCTAAKSVLLDHFVGARDQSSTMDHRALAILHRSERLVGRDGGKQLIIIAWILRFFGLLHLEEISGMYLATVGANVAFAE
jgi:hypothetical protein